MLRNSGRKWSRFSGGRDRESRWDNMNFPHSRTGNARSDPRSGDFRSPGARENDVRSPRDGPARISQQGSPFDERREEQHYRSEPLRQQLQFTPSSGFNYPEAQFSSGSPSIQPTSNAFYDPNSSNNFQNFDNLNSNSNNSQFPETNSSTMSGNYEMNFNSNLIPESPSFKSGNQSFTNSGNRNSANFPTSTSRVPVFPSTSSNTKRFNPFSFLNNDAPPCDQHRNYQQSQKNANNGQNSPFVTSPAHVNPYQHSYLPIQIVNPFARTSSNSQSNFQSGNSRAPTSHFTPPDVMNDEDKAYVQLFQQLHRENVDDDKHTDGLKKTDYAEFPSGDRITPEIYLAWRYSLEMTARVQGVSEIIDPTHVAPHIEFSVPPPRQSKVVNYWANKVHQGLAERHYKKYNYMASVMVWVLRNSKSACKFIKMSNVNPLEII